MRNKLKLIYSIPTLSLILTTGLVATSCNSNHVEDIYKTEITEDYDDPSITPLVDEEKLYNQNDITKLYIDWVNSDPMLFVKDMTWAASKKYDEFANIYRSSVHPDNPGNDNSKLVKCEFGFSKPIFGSTTVWETGFDDKTYNTISFHQTVYLEYFLHTGLYDLIKKVNIDITYSNVIFLISESNELGDASATPNWNVGILDPWFKDESFWIYQYNTMPWSIDYGASFETTKTIKGTPNVSIHNCSYFSGNVNSAIKFYNLWKFWRNIESPSVPVPPQEITCDNLLEAAVVKCIMSFEYGSKRLSNLINKPEVCVIDQLNGPYFEGQTEENPICLHKIDLIYPKIPGFDRDSVKVQLNYSPEEIPTTYIVCNGISDTRKKMRITRDQALIPDESETTNDEQPSKAYKLPIQVVGQWSRGTQESFNVPLRSLKVKILYKNSKGMDDSVETDLYLHYNTFILYYPLKP